MRMNCGLNPNFMRILKAAKQLIIQLHRRQRLKGLSVRVENLLAKPQMKTTTYCTF